jgi:hypothetical protein
MTHPHTGWFHRSDQGVLRWVPASRDTGRPAGSEADEDPGPGLEPVAAQAPSPVQGPATRGPHPVVEVKGRRPAGLDDFLGVTSFAVMKGDMTYRVFGTGDLGSGMVHFQQQDLGWDGRNIRTWTIINTPQGIVAEPDHS